MTGSRNLSAAKMPFEIQGKGQKPIVLVPGGLSGWISWKPHAEILSKSYKVIRVQLLNMAAAEKNQTPEPGYSLRAESEALKNTLDELGVKKTNLVGWSQGGAVSLDFALNHPDRISRLILIEPAAYWVGRAYGKFGEEENKFKDLLYGLNDPVSKEDLIKFLRMNDLVPPGTDPRSLPRWETWNSLKIALKSVHTVFEHTDNVERLKRLSNTPVLLVKGKDSTGANSGVVDILHRLLPNSKLLVLPDGHACHIVAMDQFITGLEEFVGPTGSLKKKSEKVTYRKPIESGVSSP